LEFTELCGMSCSPECSLAPEDRVPPPPPSPAPPPLPPAPPGAPPPPPFVHTFADPHLHFAHGGIADFRGRNGTFYSLLSAPGLNFAARTVDTDFLLPRPQLVHGSFFTQVAITVRGLSDRVYGFFADANRAAFDVIDARTNEKLGHFPCCWKQWKDDGVTVGFKQSTLYARAFGWEMNATRKPIYNHVSGPSRWRFDTSMRMLDRTAFAETSGQSSKTCFPHGIIGQSWDGDAFGISGKEDDYTYNASHPVVTTSAMAEGAIEGSADEYALSGPHDPVFKYTRFHKGIEDSCPPRDVSKLSGRKTQPLHAEFGESAGTSERIPDLAEDATLGFEQQ
jgi:hypothetical protein